MVFPDEISKESGPVAAVSAGIGPVDTEMCKNEFWRFGENCIPVFSPARPFLWVLIMDQGP